MYILVASNQCDIRDFILLTCHKYSMQYNNDIGAILNKVWTSKKVPWNHRRRNELWSTESFYFSLNHMQPRQQKKITCKVEYLGLCFKEGEGGWAEHFFYIWGYINGLNCAHDKVKINFGSPFLDIPFIAVVFNMNIYIFILKKMWSITGGASSITMFRWSITGSRWSITGEIWFSNSYC